MNIFRIKHFKEIDKENMREFSKHHEMEGTCVICGEKCYNDVAFSDHGHKWTCDSCTYKLAWYLGVERRDIINHIWGKYYYD